MAKSHAKEAILQRHVGNELLLSPTLPPVGRGAHDLSADQPTTQLEQVVVDCVTERLRAGETHYVDVPGMSDLRQALADYLQSTGLADIEIANVLVTAGMQEARFLAIQTLGNLLGPVALPEVVHPGARKALGIRPLVAASPLATDREAGFLPTLDTIRQALEGGAKVLFLESPVRLTGAVFDAAAVAEIGRLAVQHKAAVIWDQGMAPWARDYASIWKEPGMNKLTVVIGEAFPGAGLEGLFIGYVATNPEWWENIRRDKQAISICTSTPEQISAIKVAELYPAIHDRHFQALAGLCHQARSGLDGLVLPGAAINVVAVALPDIMTAPALRKNGIGFADGTDFGAPGIIRLAVTPNNTIARAIGLVR